MKGLFAKKFARFYEKKIILGTSDTWSTIHLSQQTSEPSYYILDWRIFEDCRISYLKLYPFLGNLTSDIVVLNTHAYVWYNGTIDPEATKKWFLQNVRRIEKDRSKSAKVFLYNKKLHSGSKGGGMYLVFPVIVIVTVIVLLQCLSCS